MNRIAPLLVVSLLGAVPAGAQQDPSDITGLGGLMHLPSAETRSITPDNPTGERGGGSRVHDATAAGQATEPGGSRSSRPYVWVQPGESFTLGEVDGPGVIQHIWMSVTGDWRTSIFRMYWDDEAHPSVESPVGDFFAQGWGEYVHISSMPVSVNPGSGFNSFWPKPFRQRARLTFTNLDSERVRLSYQIDYSLTEVPEEAPYFHAQFRRTNPLPYREVFTIVDGIRGKGHYVGTYLAHGANSPGWWGEGEIKFYMDGDTDFATIVGTGEEDYFLGSYSYYTLQQDGSLAETDYSAHFAGFHTVRKRDSHVDQRRYGQYRWHIPDPIRFDSDLRVTIQALGWKSQQRYLPLQDDMASVAYWYQLEPHNPFPPFPTREELEIVWTVPLNHLGRISTVHLETQPHPGFDPGARALVDGRVGVLAGDDGRWMAFEGNDFVAVLDLGSVRAVQEIRVRFLEDQEQRRFYPRAVEYHGSMDGREYRLLHESGGEPVHHPSRGVRRVQEFMHHEEMRFVKVIARNVGQAPSWHREAGRPAWLFVDELIIR
jgi:hypothetical protein